MLNFEVSCEGCVFAKLKDGIQQSCMLNKLEHVKAVLDGNYYKYDRYCKSFRDNDWLKSIGEEDPIEKINAETYPRVGLTIDFTKNYDLNLLKKTLESETEFRYIIVLNNKVEYNKEIMDILKTTRLHPSRLFIVQIISLDPKYYIDEAFKFAKKGWMCYVPNGYEFSKNFINKFHFWTNTRMLQIGVLEGEEMLMFQNILFKYLCGNKGKMLEDGSIDNRPFMEKVLSMQQEIKNKVCYKLEELDG